jgi:hypothetical protein
MKIARYLSIPMLGLFVITTGAIADPAGSDPADNPYIQSDPDGVPLSVTNPQARKFSPDEINAIHKQQQQVALDKNWLLSGYEQQLKSHAAANSQGGQDTNLYYQLSSNKELAKLAGLPTLDSDSQDRTTTFRTGAPHSGPASVALRPETSPVVRSSFSSHADLLKPLIAPFGAPNAAGLNSFSSSLPIAMASTLSGSAPQPAPVSNANQSQDSSDIETPGMVAAKKDPLMNMSSSDLTLDILPGETIAQARTHQDNNNKLELPVPMDAGQMHKQQAANASLPGAPKAAQTAANVPPPVNAAPVEDPSAPLPVSKTPQISPVRSPIASPYDILDR